MVIYLGGDASKGYADFAFLNEAGSRLAGSARYDDTPTGHAALQAVLAGFRTRYPNEDLRLEIGLEASGGLERNWLHMLGTVTRGTSSRVYQLNPLVVKRFRERELHDNVTDARSAQAIALYLRSGRRRAEVPHEPELEPALTLYRTICNQVDRGAEIKNELQALLPVVHPDLVQFCRKQLPRWVLTLLARYPTAPQLARARSKTVAQLPYVTAGRAESVIGAAKTSVASLGGAETGVAITTLAKDILRLDTQVKGLKADLIRRLRHDETVQVLTTIPGIGPWVAVVLRLEIGRFDGFANAPSVVAFSGLDPHYHRSGDGEVRCSISKRGRAHVRAALFLATLTAIRYNPAIRDFYQRLRAAGKLGMVAVTACMAKLLRIAYACAVSGEAFDPERHRAVAARYEAAAVARVDSGPGDSAPASAATPACGSLQAPVSSREAQRRRRAAAVPPTGVNRQARGHGATPRRHDTAPEAVTASPRAAGDGKGGRQASNVRRTEPSSVT